MAGRGEFQLIAELFAPLAAEAPGALGLKDDAAVLSVPEGMRLVATTDALVAGVHFLADDPPDLVARKAVRVNLSDVAAMGAAPVGLLVAACFPKEAGESWITAFAAGLAADVKAYGCPLLGGDTVATPGPATLTVTAFGTVPAGRELRRSGAREGDVVMVSGTIGDAALGLAVCGGDVRGLTKRMAEALVDRYRLPRPRTTLGPALVGLATACLDVSDGLLADLGHICTASGLGAEVDADAVPLSDAARGALFADSERMNTILCGGDDYELLFTVPPDKVEAARAAAAACGLTATPIGAMVAGEGVHVRRGAGPAEPFRGGPGWRHF